MALPTWKAKGAFASGTAALSVAWPTSGTYAVGDFALLLVESANEAITTPSGWTQATNSPQSTGTAAAAGGVRLSVYWKYATSTTEANVSVADSGDHTTAQIHVFGGVHATTPIDTTAGAVQASAATAWTLPAVTTTQVDCLIVLCLANDRDLGSIINLFGWTNANLSGLTERHDQTVTSGVGGGIGIATGGKAAAGSTGTTSVTNAASNTAAFLTIALAPAAQAAIKTAEASVLVVTASTNKSKASTKGVATGGGVSLSVAAIKATQKSASVALGVADVAQGISRRLVSVTDVISVSVGARQPISSFSLTTNAVASGTRDDLKPMWDNDAALMWDDDDALMWGGSNISTARYTSIVVRSGAATSGQGTKRANKTTNGLTGVSSALYASRKAIAQAADNVGAWVLIPPKAGYSSLTINGVLVSAQGGKRVVRQVSELAGITNANSRIKQVVRTASDSAGAWQSLSAKHHGNKTAAAIAGLSSSNARTKQGVRQASSLIGAGDNNTKTKSASRQASVLLGVGLALSVSKNVARGAVDSAGVWLQAAFSSYPIRTVVSVFGSLVSVLHQRGWLNQKQIAASVLPVVRRDISIDYAPAGSWAFVGVRLQALTDVRMWDDDDALMWTDDAALMWGSADTVYPGISVEIYQ